MKFALILLKTRTINFHLSEAFGCIVILDQTDQAIRVVGGSEEIPLSARHGYRGDALSEAYNSGVKTALAHGVPHDAIQRLAWDDSTGQYVPF